MSDKKVNIIADLVRQKTVDEAMTMLKFMPKKASKPLREAINSAASNATHNFKQKRENLVISQIIVNEGATLKRFRPVSRGRAHPIRKKTCHVTVELTVKMPEKTAKASAKKK